MRLFFVVCLLFSACATVTTYDQGPATLSPQAIMTAGTCGQLPHDNAPNLNVTPGWAQKVPGIDLQCGSKYGSGPFYCASAAACPGELVWGTHPKDPTDRGKTWHGIVDLLEGTIRACAEPANRFGWRTVVCDLKEFTATKDKPLRVALEVVVPPLVPGVTQQDGTGVHVKVLAGGTAPIVIGQMGFAEQAP